MGAVDTTYTFTATDTITSSKMNNIIDQTTMTSDAVFSGGTIEVSSGKLRVRAGSITSSELASGSVTSAAIVNGTIVNEDISNSAAIAGSKLADSAISSTKLAADSVTTAKILNANVTPAKLSEPLTLATSVSVSGSSFDLTISPTWVKKISLMFYGVKLSGSDDILVQIGSSGTPSTSGYVSGSGSTSNSTSGFVLKVGSSGRSVHGIMEIKSYGGNFWVSSHSANLGSNADAFGGGASPTLSGPINIIRIKSTGTNTFTSGAVAIMFE
jgi:hypothetical protein